MKAVNLEKLLPADFPPGERVLWFGRPEALGLWRRAYRADWVGAWFAAMAIVNFAGVAENDSAAAGAISAIRTLAFGSTALAILGLLAWLSARTTLYVVSQKRVVIKSGISLPIFINVPFKQIAAANVRAFADGAGDVTLGVTDEQRIPYLALWPSARPLRFAKPEPTLRCVANARDVAATLGRALAEAAGQPATVPTRAPAEAAEPSRIAAAVA